MMSWPLDIRTITQRRWTYQKTVSIPYEAEHGFLDRSQSPIHLDESHSTSEYYRVVLGRAAEQLEVL